MFLNSSIYQCITKGHRTQWGNDARSLSIEISSLLDTSLEQQARERYEKNYNDFSSHSVAWLTFCNGDGSTCTSIVPIAQQFRLQSLSLLRMKHDYIWYKATNFK